MVDNICLFESPEFSKLLPLVYFRPVYDLRCGILTLREKVKSYYQGIPLALSCRAYLEEVVCCSNPGLQVNKISGETCLYINGQVIIDQNLVSQVALDGEDTLYISGGTIAAAKVSGKFLDLVKHKSPDYFTLSNFKNLPQKNINVKLINYPWDLVNNNGEQIISDFKMLVSKISGNNIKGTVYDGAYILKTENVFIDEGSKIKPGVVLDAESGPIYIGRNVLIYPNAVIEGPAYIGDNSRIKIGSKIYENTSIGPYCKVGGEIEDSIIHSYSNKQHDGFLGHSYLGSWVNLGANTNNSDLKNNYSSVKVIINGEEINSGSIHAGLIMSDHSKSGINTMFNTGTVVGVSSNIFGPGFPDKYIPSFTWGGSDSFSEYTLSKSIETAKKVLKRRNIEMTYEEDTLFKKVFNLTAQERNKKPV
jgi:UDP-N-acetylglucosamine diphosphorylase/glucosamine-1-phosphate N-acetyltransferase